MSRPHLGVHSTSYDRLQSNDVLDGPHYTTAMQDSKVYVAPEDHHRTSPAGSYHRHSNEGEDPRLVQKRPTSPLSLSHHPSSPYEPDNSDMIHPPPPLGPSLPPHGSSHHPLRRSAYYSPSFTYPGRPLALQAATTLSTIILTVLPVIVKAGDNTRWGHWYSWKDLVRLIEPLVSGLFHCWFFYSADLMQGSTWNITHTAMPGAAAGAAAGGITGGVPGAAASATGTPTMRRSSTPVGLNSYLPTDEIPMPQFNQGHRKSTSSQYSYHAGLYHPSSGLGSGADDDEAAHFRPAPKSIRHSPRFRSGLAVAFTFFLMTYVTGGSLHTAAALFKSTIEFFLDNRSIGIGLSTHPLTAGDGSLSMALAQELKVGYILMQDTWEHWISHYIYAFGAVGMAWCEIIAYADQTLPRGVNLARVGRSWPAGARSGLGILASRHRSSKRLVPLYFITGILYGGILAGVSCQYPKGIYIGYAYTAVMMVAIIAYILVKERGRLEGLFSLGRYYILQTYLIGGVVALVAITIYLAVHDFSFLTSNDRSHIGTHSRP